MAGSNGCSPTADRASAHAAGPDTREGREGNGRPPDSGPDSGKTDSVRSFGVMRPLAWAALVLTILLSIAVST